MSFDALKRQIKNNVYSHKFHFFGEEVYLKNTYFQRLRNLIVPNEFSDFNLMVLEDEISIAEVDSFVNTAMFMGDKKLLVLKNTRLFKAAGSNKDFWKNLFANVPGHLYIIAYEDEFDKRNAVYKAFAEDCLSVDFEKRTRTEICAFVTKMFAKQNKSIDRDALELLADSISGDLYGVISEVEKLISLCRDKDTVTINDVSENVTKEFFTKEYVLTDALLKRDGTAAMRALSELLEMRTEPIMLIYIISSAYISTYKAKILLDDGTEYNEIIKRMKLPAAFLAKKYIDFARKIKPRILEESLSALKEADYRAKAIGEDAETCLKALVSKLLLIS